MSEQDRTRKHRRADYEQTLATIRENVGSPQHPLIRPRALWTTLVANGRLEHEFAQSALRAARDNGDVFQWTDSKAMLRYGLTDAGLDNVTASSPYGPEDTAALRKCIETEAGRENPDGEFIGWCNRRLAEVQS